MARSPWDFCTWKRRKFSKVVCMSWTVSWYFKMFHVRQFFEVILQVSFNLLMLPVGPILAFVAIFQFALGHVGSKLFATLSDQQGGNPQNGKVGWFPHVSPTVCKMKLGNWEWGASRVRFSELLVYLCLYKFVDESSTKMFRKSRGMIDLVAPWSMKACWETHQDPWSERVWDYRIINTSRILKRSINIVLMLCLY